MSEPSSSSSSNSIMTSISNFPTLSDPSRYAEGDCCWLNDLQVNKCGRLEWDCANPKSFNSITMEVVNFKTPSSDSFILKMLLPKKTENLFDEQALNYSSTLEELNHPNVVPYKKVQPFGFSKQEISNFFKNRISNKKYQKNPEKFIDQVRGRASIVDFVPITCILMESSSCSLRTWLNLQESGKGPCVLTPDKYQVGASNAIKIAIAEGLIEGLQYLHDHHVFDLDLKPESIYFSDGCTVPIKIGNVGYKSSSSSANSPYAAPMTNISLPTRPEANMFSLGLILWELFQVIPQGKRQDIFHSLVELNQRKLVEYNPFVVNIDALIIQLTEKTEKKRLAKLSCDDLAIPRPGIRFPFKFGLEKLTLNPEMDFEHRIKETEEILFATEQLTHVEEPLIIYQLCGGKGVGKTSFIKHIARRLDNHSVIYMDNFNIDDVLRLLFHHELGSIELTQGYACIYLSNKGQMRWIMIIDSNLSTSMTEYLTKVQAFISRVEKFPHNEQPLIIITSTNEFKMDFMHSRPVIRIKLNDWFLKDMFCKQALDSRLQDIISKDNRAFVNQKHNASFTKIQYAFRLLPFHLFKDFEAQLKALKYSISVFVLIGFSNSCSFYRKHITSLISTPTNADNDWRMKRSIINIFVKSGILQGGQRAPLKCPKEITNTIQKIYLRNPGFVVFLQKIFRFQGEVGMKRWVLEKLRGTKSTPLARRIFRTVSCRKGRKKLTFTKYQQHNRQQEMVTVCQTTDKNCIGQNVKRSGTPGQSQNSVKYHVKAVKELSRTYGYDSGRTLKANYQLGLAHYEQYEDIIETMRHRHLDRDSDCSSEFPSGNFKLQSKLE